MGERTSYPPGTFSWAELATSDADGAKAFYSGLFGWELEDNSVGDDMVYTMARLGGKSVAAMFKQHEREQGIPPHWNSYVTVESADDSAARAKELGGTVLFDPFDVMEVGRMAVIQDPTGAIFQVWEPRQSIGAERVNDVGSLTWNDLATTDPEPAERFYSELFGWSFTKVPGPVDYWTIQNDGRSNGGMRRQAEDEVENGVPPHWMPYFTVDSSDAAVATVEDLGGGVVVPTTEVPAGKFTVVRDPQGAFFAFFEGEADD
jgi:predicted enzyme related to lactoylglutathione lyase